eukprot:ANDGO_03161.mRNA.1 hypothetical protein H310_00289
MKMVSGSRAASVSQGTSSSSQQLTTPASSGLLVSPSFRVFPPEVRFKDVQTGIKYFMRLTIQNTSMQTKRIRVIPPAQKAFSLQYVPLEGIAPGLEQIVELEFVAKDKKDSFDRLIVMSDTEKIEVPISATFPTADLAFEPFLSVGTVVVGQPLTVPFRVQNCGSLPGEFRFSCDDSQLSIAPANGIIDPHMSQEFKVCVTCEKPGPFRQFVQVDVKNQQSRVLDVFATCVESRVELLTPDSAGVVSELVFGTMFFGEKHHTTAILVNNSPAKCSYVIRPFKEETGDSGNASEDNSDADGFGPVQADPPEGVLEPYQQAEITFILSAEVATAKRGFKSTSSTNAVGTQDYFGRMQIEVIETEQKLTFNYVGRAITPTIDVSEKRLVFGECPSNDHCDYLVTMKNQSDELPVDFSIETAPNFSVRPSKGKLLPLQSRNVVFSFTPRQLGSFEHILMVSVCGGIVRFPIRVSGSSSTIAPKKAIIGGTDKIAEDFKPELKFVDPFSISMRSSDANVSSQTGAYVVKKSDALSNPEFVKTMDHHRKYNSYIRQGKNEDEVLAAQSQHEVMYMNDRDIGLIPADGLQSPRLELPPAADPLFLNNRPGQESSQKGSPKKRSMVFDENKIIKKKFKPHPSNPAEARECATLLSPKELMQISYGPKVLDFGTLSVYSKLTKSFSVLNHLSTSVLVSLLSEREELSQSSPWSQVIPPNGTAGFDITLCSDIAQTFQQTVYFTVNGHHRLKFLVYAEIVPIDVRLSSEEVLFRFGDFSMERTVTETVSLTNTSGAPAQFCWKNLPTDGAFTVEPVSGVIQPFETGIARFTYSPDPDVSESASELLLDVKGGHVRSLRCNGLVAESKCKIAEKQLEFGIVPVGMLKTKTFRIRNVGENNAVFFVDATMPGVTVTPPRGLIGMRSSQEIQVSVKLGVPQVVDTRLVFSIRGGKSIRLPIKADAQIPSVTIPSSSFNFGEIYVNGVARRKASFRNVSAIPAVLFLDFTEHRDFSCTLEDGTAVPDHEDAPICIARLGSIPGEEGIQGLLSDDAAGKATPEQSSSRGVRFQKEDGEEDDAVSEVSSEDDVDLRRYRITVQPNEELHCWMVFSPSEVGTHEFDLPLTLAGVASAGSNLARRVRAQALASRLSLSTTMVDFRNRVVFKEIPGSELVSGHESEFTITSEEDKPVEWKFSEEALAACSSFFTLDVTEGIVLPRDTVSIKVFFKPRENKQYAATIPLILDPESPSRSSSVYAELELRGTGIYPMITFDQREIILPVVPLGFTSSYVFHVINEGYETVDLKHKLPGDTSRIPLFIKFPEGSVLDRTRLQIPVEVSFCAKKPTSFTAKIDFFDNEGNKFSIPISGTTDNSLCTIFPYVYGHREAVRVASDSFESPVLLLERTTDEMEALAKLSISSGLSVYSGGVESEAESSVYGKTERFRKQLYSRRSLERIRGFLNVCVLKNPVQDLIADFIRFNGEPLFDLVGFLSGKTADNSSKKKEASAAEKSVSQRDGVQSLMNRYDEVLSFLKSHGALLNDVRPEFLLRYEDYLRIVSLREEALLASGVPLPSQQQRKFSEKRFMLRAAEAWTNVIYQIFKVFMLNRVTWKSFAVLPGIAKEFVSVADGAITQSNFMNSAENILLKWLTYHYNVTRNKGTPFPLSSTDALSKELGAADAAPSAPWKKIINFDSDLRDGHVLFSLMESHVPTFSRKYSAFRMVCRSKEDLEHNAAIVISCMKELGLDYVPDIRDLVAPNARDMILLCWYLYQNLPSFIPKTSIDFPCQLLVPCVKNIELSNPSSRLIEFSVRLEHFATDSKDATPTFSVAEDKVRLEPKKTCSLAVTALCKFCKPVEGRITLLGRKVGQHVPSSMVFLLRTAVDTSHATKTFALEANVYEPKTLDVEVQNPFLQAGRFTVLLSQSYTGSQSVSASASVLSKKSASPPKGRMVGDKSVVQNTSSSSTIADRANFPDAFFLKADKLQLRPDERIKIPVQFLGFRSGDYVCRITFADEAVGEFVYQVNATAVYPSVANKFLGRAEENSVSTHIVVVPLKNAILDKACENIVQRMKELKLRRKAPEVLPTDEPIKYKVEYLSPYLSGPKEIVLNKKTSGEVDASLGKAKSAAKSDGDEVLPLEFRPKEAGVYSCRFLLRSAYDVRLYEFEGKALSAGHKASLEFAVPCRQSITQDIPLVNRTTNQDWVIQADLRGQYFTAPREIKVPRNSTVNFSLTFSPSWICDVRGELILLNPTTDDKMIFQLRGQAEEPLAADHVVIDCKARQVVEYQLTVTELPGNKNTANSIFDVEFDLPFFKGERLFKPSQSGSVYSFVIAPPRSGSYTGSIVFKAPSSEEFSWYTVEVNAERASAEGSVRLQTPIRQAVVAEVSITNPFDVPVEFDVRMDGAGLMGEPKVVLDAGESAAYPLVYCPLFSGQSKGSISFANNEFGEFWYDLILVAEAAEDVVLPEFRCEIGVRKSAKVRIENPIGEEITLRATSSNPQNFRGHPDTFLIGPYDSFDVEVEYCPSSIMSAETGIVQFSNPVAGTWTYKCSGVGLLPTTMEEIMVASPVGRTTTQVASFRNPFPDTRWFSVAVGTVLAEEDPSRPSTTSSAHSSLSSSLYHNMRSASAASSVPGPSSIIPDDRVYQLLLRPLRQAVKGFSTLQIPFSFTPTRMTEFNAHLLVEMIAPPPSSADYAANFDEHVPGTNQRLQWKYPIRGVAENTPSDRPFRFKCKARTRMEENVEIVLPDLLPHSMIQGMPTSGIGAQSTANSIPIHEEFTHELKIPAETSTLLNRALSIVATDDQIVTRVNQPLKYHVTFVPLRSFRATVQLVIHKKSGGRWKFDVELEATPPDPDDIIIIESNMHKTENVCFRLTNIFPTPAHFEARFTPESPLEFTVIPTSGTLAPFGSEDGTPFIVSYTATNYGKTLSGMLEILSDDMQWRYEVRGCLPEYLPPQEVKTRLDTRLSTTVENQIAQRSMQKRNFLLENLKSDANRRTGAPAGPQPTEEPVLREGSTVSRRSNRSAGTRVSRSLLP